MLPPSQSAVECAHFKIPVNDAVTVLPFDFSFYFHCFSPETFCTSDETFSSIFSQLVPDCSMKHFLLLFKSMDSHSQYRLDTTAWA